MDELREKYLQGKLSDIEQRKYEESLSAEEKKELASEIGLREGFELAFRKELKKKVASFEDQPLKSRRLNPVYVGVAASLILVATFSIFLSRGDQSLFDEYYEVYPNYELTALRGEEDLSTRERAYQAFDIGDYDLAVNQFNQMDSLSGADLFFRGMSFVQLNEIESALSDFQRVIDLEDLNYKHAAAWYSALVYLKAEQNALAKSLLEELESGNSEYAGRSAEILDDLGR